MQSSLAVKPDAQEYAPYYGKYIDLVPGGNIVQVLDEQLKETLALLAEIPESRAGYRYEEGKWSIKEVIGHVIDCERVFSYRALRFGRNDSIPIEGFEQDDYVAAGGFDNRTLADLARELEHVRRATIDLFGSFPEEAWNRAGLANQNKVSVRAVAFIIAGHERHHREVLRTRYL
jgi:hypothetical protein